MAPDKPAGSSASSGGKAKKKKWSKGKTKEKSSNAVMMDDATYDKMVKEVPTYKLVTPAVLIDRLKINGSVARRALIDLEKKGLIKPVMLSSMLPIYTRATAAATSPVTATESKA